MKKIQKALCLVVIFSIMASVLAISSSAGSFDEFAKSKTASRSTINLSNGATWWNPGVIANNSTTRYSDYCYKSTNGRLSANISITSNKNVQVWVDLYDAATNKLERSKMDFFGKDETMKFTFDNLDVNKNYYVHIILTGGSATLFATVTQ